MHWFKLSADQGNDRAKAEYSQLKGSYDGFLALRAKALTGNAGAEAAYARALAGFETLYGVFDPTTSAHNWYRGAAEQGNAEGQYAMGADAYRAWTSHLDGELAPQSEADPLTGNFEIALQWLNKSAAQGYADAELLLALSYGSNTPHHDDKLARHWLEMAAPSSEESEGLFCQLDYEGILITRPEFWAGSKVSTIRAAPQYDRAFACFTRHVGRSEKAAALSYWYLADSHHLGRGTPHDDRKAIDLFAKALDTHSTSPGFIDLELARIYSLSLDMKWDFVKAYQLYTDASHSLWSDQQYCADTPENDPVTNQFRARAKTAQAQAAAERAALVAQLSREQRKAAGVTDNGLADEIPPPITIPCD